MQLIRWSLQPPDVEQWLRQVVLPAVRDPELMQRAVGFYVRRGQGEGWLTVYAEDAQVASLRDEITDRIGAEATEPGTAVDAILADTLAWYRRALQQVCETSLDLLGQNGGMRDLLRAVRDPWDLQRFFPTPLPGETYRVLLHPTLQRAAPYNALTPEDRAAFWDRFPRWPGDPHLDYLSPPGHWLWNILDVPS